MTASLCRRALNVGVSGSIGDPELVRLKFGAVRYVKDWIAKFIRYFLYMIERSFWKIIEESKYPAGAARVNSVV